MNLLLLGDGLSAFGTWIDFIAILTLSAYQYHVTPVQMAVVSAAMLLPGVLLAPATGRLCDGKDPKRLLLASIVLRVACTAGVLLLHDFAVFLLLIGLRSVFAGVAPPAINVMANRAIGQDALPRFYSVLNVLNSAAKIIAPALGTVSSSLSSEALALVMSAVFSAASFAVFVFVAPTPPAPQPGDAGGDAGADARPAPTARAPVALMLPLLWIAGAYAFSVFMVNSLVPVVLQRAGFDKSLLGILISCSGAGNILSGTWLARTSAAGCASSLKGQARETTVPALLQAGGFAAIALLLWAPMPHKAYVLPVLFFIIGTFSARYAIALNVYLSTHHAGRIGVASGAVQSAQNTMILLAPMVGALVLDAGGGAALFAVAAGSALALYALFPLIAPMPRAAESFPSA